MQLLDETKQLLQECENCLTRFQNMRDEDREPDFFNEVKPHADLIHAQLKNWQQLAHEWINNTTPKNLYVQQIDYAQDAMEQFVVQSFYKGTSKKRFIQSIQSTMYTLNLVVRKIEEGEEHAK
jgi:hypothetical protein